MRFVVQRVTHASVTVDSQVIGKIGNGFMVLIGVADTDTREIADKMVKKLLGLRIFEDQNGKTNLDMQTAVMVTVRALLRQESRIWPTKCMSTSLQNAKSRYRWWKKGNLARI